MYMCASYLRYAHAAASIAEKGPCVTDQASCSKSTDLVLVSLKCVVKHIHSSSLLRALVLCWSHSQIAGQWLDCLKGAIAGITFLQIHSHLSTLDNYKRTVLHKQPWCEKTSTDATGIKSQPTTVHRNATLVQAPLPCQDA